MLMILVTGCLSASYVLPDFLQHALIRHAVEEVLFGIYHDS